MAEFDFEVLGQPLRVEYRREGKGVVVRCGGGELIFSPEFRGENLVYLKSGDRTVAARVLRAPEGIHVAVDGETYLFEYSAASPDGGGRRDRAILEPGSHMLKVPMPGTVAKVLVGEGEKVGADQALVIVEAMKMENSVRAPAHCKVGRIHVIEGDVVNPGDPLLEMII